MLERILKEDELSRLSIDEQTLSLIRRRIQAELHADEHDDCWAELARFFIGQGRFEEAETLIPNISEDWASIAVELLAECAAGYWTRDCDAKAYSLLVQALRLSKGCHDWRWAEAESMTKIAKAAQQIGLPDVSKAIFMEAAELAGQDAELSDGLRSLDACGVLRGIARELALAGSERQALEVAMKITSPTKQAELLEELALAGR